MTDKKKIIEIEEQGKYFKFSNKIYEVYHISENLNDGYKEFKNKIDEKINYFEKNNIKTNIKNAVNGRHSIRGINCFDIRFTFICAISQRTRPNTIKTFLI